MVNHDITASDFLAELETKVETETISEDERKILLHDMADMLNKTKENGPAQEIFIGRKPGYFLSIETDTYTRYYSDEGIIAAEEWLLENKTHREGDMPARIVYDKKGRRRVATWFKRNAIMRSGGKPAVINYSADADTQEDVY